MSQKDNSENLKNSQETVASDVESPKPENNISETTDSSSNGIEASTSGASKASNQSVNNPEPDYSPPVVLIPKLLNMPDPAPIIVPDFHGGAITDFDEDKKNPNIAQDINDAVKDAGKAAKIVNKKIPGLSQLTKSLDVINVIDHIYNDEYAKAISVTAAATSGFYIAKQLNTMNVPGAVNAALTIAFGVGVNEIVEPIANEIHEFIENSKSAYVIDGPDGITYLGNENNEWIKYDSNNPVFYNDHVKLPTKTYPSSTEVEQLKLNEIVEFKLDTIFERVKFNGRYVDSYTTIDENENGEKVTYLVDGNQRYILEGGKIGTVLRGDNNEAAGLRIVTDSYGNHYSVDYAIGEDGSMQQLSAPYYIDDKSYERVLNGESAQFNRLVDQISQGNRDLSTANKVIDELINKSNRTPEEQIQLEKMQNYADFLENEFLLNKEKELYETAYQNPERLELLITNADDDIQKFDQDIADLKEEREYYLDKTLPDGSKHPRLRTIEEQIKDLEQSKNDLKGRRDAALKQLAISEANANIDTNNIEIDSTTYQVVSGDTFSTVMDNMGLDYDDPVERDMFLNANNIEDANHIHTGDSLVNPFGGLDAEEREIAKHNFVNADSQSVSDMKDNDHKFGEAKYQPDAIVGFDGDGNPVTAEEKGLPLVEPEQSIVEQYGSAELYDEFLKSDEAKDFWLVDKTLTPEERANLSSGQNLAFEEYLKEHVVDWDDNKDGVFSDDERKFRDDLNEFATKNHANAASQSDSDRKMHEADYGEGKYQPDAIVDFEDGRPVTAAEMGYPLVDPIDLDSSKFSDFNESLSDIYTEGNWEIHDAGRSMVDNANAFYEALEEDDLLEAVSSGLDLATSTDNYFDLGDKSSGSEHLFSDETAAALSVASSSIDLIGSIDEGDIGDIVVDSASLAMSIERFIDPNGTDAGMFDEATMKGLGTALAAYGLYESIQSGDATSIAVSGLQLYGAITQTPMPGLAYVDSVVKLLDGDVEGAAISAALATLGVFFGFAGFAVGFVLSSLMGSPPPPEAWADFTVNDDGTISFGVGANKTGKDLIETVESVSDGLVDFLYQIQDFGVEVKTEYIPQFGIRKQDFFLDVKNHTEDGISIRHFMAPEDISQGMMDLVIFKGMVDRGETSFSFAPDIATVTEGIGVGRIIGGGQRGGFKGVVVAQNENIIKDPLPTRTVTHMLDDVSKTWRISKGMFEGENGRLLAMGLAAGLITFDEVALAALPEPAKVSVENNPVYRSLIEEVKGAYIAAGAGLFGEVEFFDAALTVAPSANFSESINEDYIARRDKLYIEPNLPEVANAAGNEVNSATGVDPLVDRPAVIFSNESTNEPTISIDDLADDDFVFSAGATANLSAGAGSTFGKIVLPPTPPPPPPPGTDELFSLEDREVFSSIDELMANDPEFIAHQAALASGAASATPGVVFVGLGAANNGTVSLWADGTIHFVPDADFHGLAGFSYTIEDASGKQTTHEVQVKVDNVNDRPEAVSDTLTVVEDGRINLKQLLTNDSDTDLDTLNLAAVSSVSAGRIEVDAAGNYFYVADTDYIGEVELTYVVDDGSGDPASRSIAQAVINVTAGANDAPVVQSEVALADGLEDNVYRFNVSDVLVGAYDPEGDDFDVTTMALADDSVGSLTFDSATGEIEFTPRSDFHGEVVFNVEVSDSNGATTHSQARLQIASSVDAISTGDHTLTIVEDAVTLLDPQTFIDGVANPGNEHVEITAVRMVDGEIGQVQLLANGWVQFIPAPEYSGETAFEVRLSNGEDRIVSRVAVDITAVNDAPLVVDDILSGGIEEQVFDFHVDQLLVNDVDAEGDAYEFLSISLDEASQGQLSHDAATGAIQFTPNEDVFGEIGLHYRVVETATGRVSEGVATLLLSNVDDTVDLIDAWRELDEDKPLYYSREQLLSLSHLDANDYKDADGQRLEIVAVRLADGSHGEVELDDQGGVLYQPGVDATDSVELIYTVSDGVSEIEGRIQVQIKPENDAPRTQADAINGALEDTEFVFDSASLLTNDSDPEGDALTVESVKLTDVNAGLLVFDAVDGSVRFTPALNVFGKVGISYTVSDGNNSETQVSEIIVDTSADDFAVVDQVYELDEDEVRVFTKEELLSDYADSDYKDSDGQDLEMKEVRLLSGATGEVELTGDGEVKFTPEVEMHGTTGFEVLISDGDQGHWQRIDLTITEVNDLPDAQADVLTGAVEEQLFEFKAEQLLVNDSDAEGDAFGLTSIKLAQEEAGELIWDEATGKVQYIPALNVFGEVKLTYTLTETVSGRKSEGQAIIEVAGTEDDFVLSDKDYRHKDFNVDEDSVTQFTAAQLLSEYAPTDASSLVVDADNQALTITKAQMLDTTQGTVELTSEGNVKFTPAKDFNGLADAEITVTDGVHEHQMAVQLKVWAENDAPNLVEDTRVMDEEGVLTVSEADLLANDVDVDSANFKIVGVWQASGGVARYDADSGVLTYEPDENIYGEALIEYLVADDQGAFSVGKLQVSITNSDDAVLAVSDRLLAEEDKAIIFEANALLANDENPDGEVLTITSIDASTITDGKLTLLADGRIEYLPNANTHGIQRFSYTVADESGNESVGHVELVVEEVNDTPTVQAMHESMNEDETISFTTAELLSFASDVEDDWIRVEGIRSDYGHVNLDTYTGIASFTPKANFNSDLHGGDAKVEILFADERFGETWAPMLVHVAPVNDEPIAGDDVLFAWETGALDYVNPVRADWLFANDIEVDGETLRLHDISLPPSYGEILWDSSDPGSNDVIGYKADAGFIGADEFEYVVHDGAIHTDGKLSLDNATVRVQVEDNHAPIATDFGVIAAEDTDLLFTIDDFMVNVFDQDLGHEQLPEVHKIIDVDEANALNGEVILNADGTVTFKPNQDYNSVQHGGVAQFSYTVQDIVGNTSTADVSITYTPVNDAPVAGGLTLGKMDEDGGGFEFNTEQLLSNAIDVDGDALTLSDFRAGNGQLYDLGGGVVRYVPPHNYNGVAKIHYQVSDGELTGDGIGKIVVKPVNDDPWTREYLVGGVGKDNQTNTLNGAINPANAGDIDGDTIKVVITGWNGSVTHAYTNGSSIFYRGNAGSGKIFYEIHDPYGGKSDQATAPVNIIHVDEKPTSAFAVQVGDDDFFIAGRDPDTPSDKLNVYVLDVSGKSDVGPIVETRVNSVKNYVIYNGSYGVNVHGVELDVNFYVDSVPGYSSSSYNDGTVYLKVGVSDGVNYQVFNISTRATWGDTFRIINRPGGNSDGPQKPIVFDLNGNGLSFVSASEGLARYDFNDNGHREVTGWIAGEGDGLLAYDNDEDGIIKNHDEISFVSYLEGAQTDLEGLRAFDSNGDGRFGVGDARWGKFGVWIDDGDGLSEAGEFVTLDSLGIVSINLTSDGNQQMLNGNVIYGMTDVTLEDGSVIQAGDVGFQTLLEAPLAGLEQSLSFDPLETDEQESEEAESVLGEDSEEADEAQSESSDETIDADEDEQQAQADAESDDIENESSESSQQASDAMNDEAVDTTGDDQLNDSADSTTTEEQQASTNEADDNSQEDDGWQWPTDEELDQIALHDNHMAAAVPPTDSVPPSDTNPDAVPPPPMPKSEEEEVTSIF